MRRKPPEIASSCCHHGRQLFTDILYVSQISRIEYTKRMIIPEYVKKIDTITYMSKDSKHYKITELSVGSSWPLIKWRL